LAVLDDVKIILGTTEDILLNLYIRKADTLIKNYLRLDDTVDIEAIYSDAVIQYVVENYRQRGNEGIKQFSQGSRSGTYNSGLSSDVKVLLPLPKIKLMG
jgi:hypothetical protein